MQYYRIFILRGGVPYDQYQYFVRVPVWYNIVVYSSKYFVIFHYILQVLQRCVTNKANDFSYSYSYDLTIMILVDY